MLVRVLFPDPPLVRTPISLLRWWEARRLTYNAVVGASGLVTVGVIETLSLLFGFPGGHFPWLLVGVYGLLANVAYSFGWVAEATLQKWLRRETYGLGPALFRHGLVFSVGLTLFPAALATLASLVRLFVH
ncbi:MAG: hypothetical protein KGN74_05590 [Gemmatimonadota bacterium]|nr:hypothetical protein [Gemmatimonadota bacterium]MDE3172526.1 hypothetical protein [Gemmatimonadota bacterium]MDE3216633.1 hypothetical protein [Gemmatimonadota bacterium]